MQLRLVSTLLGVVVLTVLLDYLPSTEAASTQRPYEFGFSIEKQQHRHEKKDERGIVMGEFGFITADGIYHVTVYATDEEGKFRILAMRSYPYEENPKTIEMVVRPKAKPTTPKAIAPPSPSTTTERAKPKPFEKHNFSVQGCSGCFIKNNAPTTTQKPEDKKYDISLLSKPLAPEGTPVIGKQIVSQVLPQVLPQVIQEVQLVETRLKQTTTNVVPRVTAGIGSAINLALSEKNTQQQTTQKVHTAFLEPHLTTPKAQKTPNSQSAAPLATQTNNINAGKPIAGFSTNTNHLSLSDNAPTITRKPQLTTTQKAQGSKPTQHNLPLATQTQIKPFETLNTNGNNLNPAFVQNKAPKIPSAVAIPQNIKTLATQTQVKLSKPFETLSTNANHLSPVIASNVANSAPPGTTLNAGKAKTSTTGANTPQAPGKTGTNVPKAPSNQPAGGVKGSTSSISTPNTQITAPAINAGNTGGGKGNAGGANTGIGGASGGSSGFGGTNNFGGNSGSSAAKGAVGSKAGGAAGFGSGAPGSKVGSAAGFAGGSPGSQAGNAAGFGGGSPGSQAGNAAGFGGSSTGSKTGSAAGFVGGPAGSKSASAVGEAGDLYRFKYLLDYNGHRETGSQNGNKEGSFYAIGDDNVERTIEYIANEFGYQPRVRFRKLDAPVQAKENTLKDYEFVWFRKA
ncbi:protein lethal(3)malignant blood neoplasm 1 isoform X2 [Bactrocera dorsalis]|uniref:Protein lethal(3)malignant blood neoplasm 1 isoform X2 n=1 Tax=Bactrocera dorsalis TaxID=27457 RepID=A0A8N4L5I3_BACDO|nr:protein lethal(3)malignant blood neoplasm 1 isoform X2 [Bactrocera dorsalis]